MEKWIHEAKEQAKMRAKCFIEDCFEEADELQVERIWFLEEAIKNVHRLKEDRYKE